MRSTMLVVKDRGKKIDDDFLTKIAETHGTSAGVMVVKDGELITESCDPGADDQLDLIDWVTQTQKVFLDQTCFFSFSNADIEKGEFSEESIQPWSLLVEGEGDSAMTKLAVIVDGEFNGTYEAGADTAEYCFVANYLAEKIGSIHKTCGGDYKKTFNAMSDPKLKEDLQEHLNPRGAILMLSDTGKAWGFDINNLGIKMSWGGASKSMGFKSDVAEEKKVEAPPTVVAKKKMSIAERAKAAAEGLPAQSPPDVEVPGKEGDRSQPEVKPTGEPPKVPDNIGYTKAGALWLSVPQGLDHKGIVTWWGRHFNGSRPKDDHKLLEGFPAAQLKKESPYYAFCNQPSTAIKDAIAKARATKDKEKPKSAVAGVDGKPAPQNPTALGIISAESKKNILEMVKTDKNLIHDVDTIVNSTKEFPLFSEQVAMKIEDIARWRPEAYLRLDKQTAANLINELRLELIQRNPEMFEKKVEEAAAPAAEATPPKKLSIAERARLAAQQKVA